jgi:hypothetical protein
MKPGCLAISAVVLVLAFSGCVTFDHAVSVAPLVNKSPLSASSSYRDEAGSAIGPEEYEILEHFRIEKDAVFPLIVKGRPVVVDFNADIDDVLRRRDADAVVNLHFKLLHVDTGDEKKVRFWRELGEWTLGIGLSFLGATWYYQPRISNETWAGGIVAGTGLFSLLVSWGAQANGKTTMTLSAEGDVVRFLE